MNKRQLKKLDKKGFYKKFYNSRKSKIQYSVIKATMILKDTSAIGLSVEIKDSKRGNMKYPLCVTVYKNYVFMGIHNDKNKPNESREELIRFTNKRKKNSKCRITIKRNF